MISFFNFILRLCVVIFLYVVRIVAKVQIFELNEF